MIGGKYHLLLKDNEINTFHHFVYDTRLERQGIRKHHNTCVLCIRTHGTIQSPRKIPVYLLTRRLEGDD